MNKTYYNLICVVTLFIILYEVNYVSSNNAVSDNEEETTAIESGSVGVLSDDIVHKSCDETKLRFLTIGGSVAAGEGVTPEQAYPHLLCKGDKIANPNIKPGDVAYCLKSIIGNKIYDVIVIDLFDHNDIHTNNLVIRLIKRFPGATIINLMNYFPSQIGFRHHGSGWVPVSKWALETSGEKHMTDKFLKQFEESHNAWQFIPDNEKLKLYHNITWLSSAIWTLHHNDEAKYKLKGKPIKDLFLKRAWLYSDWTILNVDGHKEIASGILSEVNMKLVLSNHSDVVNPWDKDTGDC